MIGRTLAAAAVAAVALAVAPAAAMAVPEPETVPPCRFEDGSGQSVCVWDARHLGNGRGVSYVAIRGGTDRAVYRNVRHSIAHRLTFGPVR